MIIVDIRKYRCSWGKEHITTAIWQTLLTHFYDTLHDLLIYSQDEKVSKTYCEELIKHVYGKIFYLEGGIEAWKKAAIKLKNHKKNIFFYVSNRFEMKSVYYCNRGANKNC